VPGGGWDGLDLICRAHGAGRLEEVEELTRALLEQAGLGGQVWREMGVDGRCELASTPCVWQAAGEELLSRGRGL